MMLVFLLGHKCARDDDVSRANLWTSPSTLFLLNSCCYESRSGLRGSPASLCAIATYCPGSFGLFNLGKQIDEWVKSSMNTPLPIYTGSPSAVSLNTACWAESTSGCSQSLLPSAGTMTIDASAFLSRHFAFSPRSSAASGSASLIFHCHVLHAHGPEQRPGACPVPAHPDKGTRLLYRINYFSYGQNVGIQGSIPICLKEVFLVCLYV